MLDVRPLSCLIMLCPLVHSVIVRITYPSQPSSAITNRHNCEPMRRQLSWRSQQNAGHSNPKVFQDVPLRKEREKEKVQVQVLESPCSIHVRTFRKSPAPPFGPEGLSSRDRYPVSPLPREAGHHKSFWIFSALWNFPQGKFQPTVSAYVSSLLYHR